MSERTANSAPLSEPSHRITATEKEEKDVEEVQAEVYDSNVSNDREEPVVHQEEEQFEWREVVRGMADPSPLIICPLICDVSYLARAELTCIWVFYRVGGCSSVADGDCVFWHYRQHLLVFTISVSSFYSTANMRSGGY